MNKIHKISFFAFASISFAFFVNTFSEAQQNISCSIFKSGKVQVTSDRNVCRMKIQGEQRYKEVFEPKSDVKVLLDDAEKAIKENKNDLALSLWSRALSKSENLPLALLKRGSLYLLQGKYNQGYEDLFKLESMLRKHGFQEKADVISQMIKDTKAEYAAEGISIK